MEEEGIYYYFEHTAKEHTLIMANVPESHRPCPSKSTVTFALDRSELKDEWIPAIHSWRVDNKLRTGTYELRDFHFQLPTNNLLATHPSLFDVAGNKNLEDTLSAGAYPLTTALKLRADGQSKATALPGPLLFQPGSAALALKHRYRGSIQIDVSAGKLRAINMVGLEQYLYGVVPSEMPYTWPPEALKAQAIAARSYALATRRTGAFDLYPDTRSQVYLGIEHEKPSTNAAVNATAGQVVLYDGSSREDVLLLELGRADRVRRRRLG